MNLTPQDKLFLRTGRITWNEPRQVVPGIPVIRKNPVVLREHYQEAVDMAVFYEAESWTRQQKLKQVTAQRNMVFVLFVSAFSGFTAACLLLVTQRLWH